jgi:hypothetical protein
MKTENFEICKQIIKNELKYFLIILNRSVLSNFFSYFSLQKAYRKEMIFFRGVCVDVTSSYVSSCYVGVDCDG